MVTQNQRVTKRVELFAYVSNEFTKTIHFTRHFSKFAAEKHYGDTSRHWRGGAHSDFYLTVLTRDELEALGKDYEIDWKERTLTPRKETA